MGKILLFYKYVHIENPQEIAKWQRDLCQKLGLNGRIILAHEGINATVGGTEEAAQAYIDAMNAHPLFGEIDFKESMGGADYFPRLRIVVKNEIVNLGLDPEQIKAEDGGKHLTPDEVHELLQNKPDDLVILDARNNYESAIGTFTGSITPDINNFRDLPKFIEENIELFKDKKVLMHCTGGIRCERASAYLKSKGVAQEVYQILGGIQRYTEQYPDGFFRGKNYVFDSRIAVKINDDVLGKCYLCNNACNDYSNCWNAMCNRQFLCCQNCNAKYNGACSQECNNLLIENKVPRRPKKFRVPNGN